MLVIQIRGTSGSGKTTAMRSVMDTLLWNPVHVPGRKKPLYYLSDGTNDEGRVCVLGHYDPDTPSGGCDTIGSAPQIRDVIYSLPGNIDVVLSEGALWSEDVKWTLDLVEKGHEVKIIFLSTPYEECVRRVHLRRQAKGNDEPLDEFHTSKRFATIERARKRLVETGITCRRASGDQTSSIVINWIRLHANQEKRNAI